MKVVEASASKWRYDRQQLRLKFGNLYDYGLAHILPISWCRNKVALAAAKYEPPGNGESLSEATARLGNQAFNFDGLHRIRL